MRLLWMFFFFTWSLVSPNFTHANPTQQTVWSAAQLLQLKQLGYSEQDIIMEAGKYRIIGRFQFTPQEKKRLQQAGFSASFLRKLSPPLPPKIPNKASHSRTTPVPSSAKPKALAYQRPTWLEHPPLTKRVQRLLQGLQSKQLRQRKEALQHLADLPKQEAAAAAEALGRSLVPQTNLPMDSAFKKKIFLILKKLGPQAYPALPYLFRNSFHNPSLINTAGYTIDAILTNPLVLLPQILDELRTNRNYFVRVILIAHLQRIHFEKRQLERQIPNSQRQTLAQIKTQTQLSKDLWQNGWFFLSNYYLDQKQKEWATLAFVKAIHAGFDICGWPQMFRKLRRFIGSDPRIIQAHKQIQIKFADQHEFLWLIRENQLVSKDTLSMIRENIGRKDHGATMVPQSTLSFRPTTSPAVRFAREIVRNNQRWQRLLIMRSDHQRKTHLTSMMIINNMNRQSLFQRQQQLRMRLFSKNLAKQRALARIATIKARRYQLPPQPNRLLHCPPYHN